MDSIDPKRVLFVGRGKSAVGWYRCYLPAMALGADWVGCAGDPPNLALLTGLVKQKTQPPVFADYDIIVLQQPSSLAWMRSIIKLRESGKIILYEIDDYLHAIRKMKDHDFRAGFEKPKLELVEKCMKVCDGVICSTDFIGRMYRKFSKRTFVCRNGIDPARYNLTRPVRPTVNIGWAGATGHQKAVAPWIAQVANVMREKENTTFVSIGQPWGRELEKHFPNRAISTPFTSLETYPAAMTMFDIALAPAGHNNFFRGKSDLRWLEASALGIPVIADPGVYPEIEDGWTGFHASEPREVRELLLELVENSNLRTEVGERARRYVREFRSMTVMKDQWQQVFEEVRGDAAEPQADGADGGDRSSGGGDPDAVSAH